ncbi:MAG TPA: hypothetical protein VFF27_15645 [Bacteroidia bacterium]|nr:hypothetical protein [Bacteroidia bacterium]
MKKVSLILLSSLFIVTTSFAQTQPNNSTQSAQTESKDPVKKDVKEKQDTSHHKPTNQPHPNGKNNHGMEMKAKNKAKQTEKKEENKAKQDEHKAVKAAKKNK